MRQVSASNQSDHAPVATTGDPVTLQAATQPLPPPPAILPPHWFFLALLSMLVMGWLAPDDPAPTWLWLSGLPLIVLGARLAAAALRLFSKAGTNIIPLTRSTTLVTSSVFGWSRNPMYLGMLIALTGVALLTRTWLTWPVLIAFFALIRQRFIVKEEALLAQTFGEACSDYRVRVRRWL